MYISLLFVTIFFSSQNRFIKKKTEYCDIYHQKKIYVCFTDFYHYLEQMRYVLNLF